MSAPALLVIADDLTGAADTGVAFAAAGYATAIPLSRQARPTADVLSLTTESRDLRPEQAFAAVHAAVERSWHGTLGNSNINIKVYKKIDSALRGHPGPELAAVMHGTGIQRAIVAPAFPAEGRTTRGGMQYLHGRPLEHGPMGVASSNVGAVIGLGHAVPVRHLGLDLVRGDHAALTAELGHDVPEIVVVDAETDDDLARVAQAAAQAPPAILSGAAGFARALARALPLSRATIDPIALDSSARPVLVVAGSQHGATERQVEALRDSGMVVVQLAQAFVDADETVATTETEARGFIAAVAAALAAGKPTVATTAGLAPARAAGRTVADRLAAIATAPAVIERVGGLSLTGGDVAMAVCMALGAEAIWLRGEIVAGQPWGVLEGGKRPGLPVATKAGSFGDANALCAAVAFLTALQRG